MLRNWGLVFVGNFAGALTTAFFASFILTYGYKIDGGVIAEKVATIGESRTLGYKERGMGAGLLSLFAGCYVTGWYLWE